MAEVAAPCRKVDTEVAGPSPVPPGAEAAPRPIEAVRDRSAVVAAHKVGFVGSGPARPEPLEAWFRPLLLQPV